MAEKKETTVKTTKSGSSAAGVSIRDVFFMTIRHWPWILLSIAVCLGVAYIYLLRTPDIYSRSADIMIKDESKGKTGGMEQFADIGLIQSNSPT